MSGFHLPDPGRQEIAHPNLSKGLTFEQAQKDHALCLSLGGVGQALPQSDGTFTVICTFSDEQPAPTPNVTPAAALAPAGPFTAAPPTTAVTRDDFIAHMKAKLGYPYIWGANGPTEFDCSGYAQYALEYLGLDPIGDQTARRLYSHFRKEENGRKLGAFETSKLGDLAFYGAPSSVSHVSVCLNAEDVIEAGGGGRHTTKPKAGAEVRIVKLARRDDLAAILRPHGVPTW